jgi:hypothetical protein
MPPCGFNPNSVRGGLAFVRGCYEDLLDQVRSRKFKDYDEAIEFELKQIRTALHHLGVEQDRIAEGFEAHAVPGALGFIQGCYEDLLNSVRSGRFRNYEEAIDFELDQLAAVLGRLHIDEAGRLVSRAVTFQSP